MMRQLLKKIDEPDSFTSHSAGYLEKYSEQIRPRRALLGKNVYEYHSEIFM